MENVDGKNVQALRAYRQRRREGRAILPVEVQSNALVAALIRRGVIEPGRQISRAELAGHAGVVLRLWADEQKDPN